MQLEVLILTLMVIGALWTVIASNLLKSAIGLAVTSAILSVLMFRLNAPLAAVFELSVCAGLITVVFISVISLTRANADPKLDEHKTGFGRYLLLLAILIAGIAVAMMHFQPELGALLSKPAETNMRLVLWGQRQLDLFGQVVVLLVGIFGVVVLLKEKNRQKR